MYEQFLPLKPGETPEHLLQRLTEILTVDTVTCHLIKKHDKISVSETNLTFNFNSLNKTLNFNLFSTHQCTVLHHVVSTKPHVCYILLVKLYCNGYIILNKL